MSDYGLQSWGIGQQAPGGGKHRRIVNRIRAISARRPSGRYRATPVLTEAVLRGRRRDEGRPVLRALPPAPVAPRNAGQLLAAVSRRRTPEMPGVPRRLVRSSVEWAPLSGRGPLTAPTLGDVSRGRDLAAGGQVDCRMAATIADSVAQGGVVASATAGLLVRGCHRHRRIVTHAEVPGRRSGGSRGAPRSPVDLREVDGRRRAH